MNKEDLIKKYEGLEGVWDANGAEIARQCFLRDLEQLNEIDTKKVTVPQYVADWYEENKDDFEGSLFRCVYELFKKRNDNEPTKFEEWIIDGETEPFLTLVNMHQFGYEVEQEKRYLVKMKDLESGFNFLNRHKRENYWVFSSNDESITYQVYHTRKELEDAGFGEVFNSSLFEVEEVEE